MATLLPTKELLQMIEERIPYGRFLTTAALLLALLAVIVGACSYLYHAVVSPISSLIIAGVTTGKINRSMLSTALANIVGTTIVLSLFEWMVRGSSRLMREVLDSQKDVLKNNDEILTIAKETNDQMLPIANTVADLDARVSALENRLQ
jgi:formate/nitrite transporter FocA (FNT family)